MGRAQQHHYGQQPVLKEWFKEYEPKRTPQGTTVIHSVFENRAEYKPEIW